MDLIGLAIVSLMIAGSVVYLVTHAKLYSTMFGTPWSPRLAVCKILIPADIILTITLVIGPMFFGISGIMAFIAGGFTAVGLSIGVYVIKRVFVPHWEREYNKIRNSYAHIENNTSSAYYNV